MNSVEKSILVPIDLSDVTDAVVATAIQYAVALHGKLHLLHVREYLPALPPTMGMEAMPMMTPIALLPPEIEIDLLQPWRERLAGAGINFEAEERLGMVDQTIVDVANERGADLIVMGSHGHGAMYDLLVGSVAHAVLKKATCPVLIVPARRA